MIILVIIFGAFVLDVLTSYTLKRSEAYKFQKICEAEIDASLLGIDIKNQLYGEKDLAILLEDRKRLSEYIEKQIREYEVMSKYNPRTFEYCLNNDGFTIYTAIVSTYGSQTDWKSSIGLYFDLSKMRAYAHQNSPQNTTSISSNDEN